MTRFQLVVPVSALLLAACSEKVVRGPLLTPPTSVARVMDRQVTNAVDMGEGDIRVRQLRERMVAEPGNLGVRLELASRYSEMGFPELALEHYRLAAEKFPDDAPLHLRLAKALRAQGAASQAIEVLDRFLDTHQDSPAELHSWSGILHDEAGQFEDGEKAHRRALAAGKPAAYLRNNLGHSLLLAGRREAAAAEFRAALKLEPRSELIRNNLAAAMSADLKEAALQLQSVADPATAHSNLAAILIDQARYQEARAELNLALGYRRDHPAALKNLALLAELDGQPAVLKPNSPPGVWARWADALNKFFRPSEDARPDNKPKAPANSGAVAKRR